MKFLIAVFLPASPFINFGDFCQPPRLLFWPKFTSLPVYSTLAYYLKLESIELSKVAYQADAYLEPCQTSKMEQN